MFTDTHCHLYKEYYDEIDKVIEEAKNNNVNQFFVAGCDQKTNEEVISLKNQYTSIKACIGIHPENVNTYQEKDLTYIENHIDDIIAIGEIGLDYHYEETSKENQINLLKKQLEIAEKYQLPVVIHCRDAFEDMIDILPKYHVKGVIHSFSGTIEEAKTLISLGFKLGINGIVTFKNSNLIKIIPQIINDIILETDSPYLTPDPYRGKQNSPKHIIDIASFISKNLNISLEELALITSKNISLIFDI